ncbi:transporter [Peptostreptococcus sp. MV1]|uniref:AEC family transporter n=1 Tax=Peptostreptococcus sp. MV1 TaxID=1219626 RepID=UPI00050ECFC8|nr:AEC family transporter [Peptostreptococcus sp. MV1]KGF12731.1 transporter [Peptostreptococcus sp. MV1]
MKVVETLFPVFFMVFLGLVSRSKNWISWDQKEGAKKIVFGILFPALIFHVIFVSDLSINLLKQIVFLDVAWIIVYLIGKILSRFVGERYRSLAPFLLMTCEGGNVALPLYISLVGSAYALNIVTFDVAGIIINFGLVPILVSRQVNSGQSAKGLLKNIFTNSFVLAVLLGILANLIGLHGILESIGLATLYGNTMTAVLAPITGIILFTLGHDLKVDLSTLKSLFSLMVIRLVLCGLIIGGFYLVFPGLMADPYFKIAVFLYFMCPTGFPVPLQLSALCDGKDQESFMSAFISVYMLITLVAYTLITVFK